MRPLLNLETLWTPGPGRGAGTSSVTPTGTEVSARLHWGPGADVHTLCSPPGAGSGPLGRTGLGQQGLAQQVPAEAP